MVTAIGWLWLVACRPPTSTPDTLTSTFPQFHGNVPKNLLIVSIDTTRTPRPLSEARSPGSPPQ